jgi:short subunit dehydrogenase-like uncharacterized protein
MINRYDIVILGATGFTGQLISKYMSSKAEREGIQWAIAGRNTEKLQQLVDSLPGRKADIIQADVNDQKSLDIMTQSSKVLLNAAGPFSIYGPAVVKSCVENQCHYLDITGEPEFINHCYLNYHKKAQEQGIIMVNCCGFDSIPADFTTWMAVKALNTKAPRAVRCFFRTNAAFSGGTLNTAIHAIHQKNIGNRQAELKFPKHPDAPKINRNIHKSPIINQWVLPMPVADVPIVRRSAMQMPEVYGDAFSYGQFFARSSFWKLLKMVVPMIAGVFMIRFKFFRDHMQKKFKPGTGPSEDVRAGFRFEVRTFAEAIDGSKAVAVMSGTDPGYNETAKMVSEAAFCILDKINQGTSKSGVLTPVEAFGQSLVDRLTREGIIMELE